MATCLRNNMKRLLDHNINSREFWDVQYSPERRYEYRKQNLAYPKYIDGLKYIKDGDKVLDMACGLGMMAEFAKEDYPNADVWAFDQSNIIDSLKEKFPKIHWSTAELGKEEVPDDFDVVFGLDLVEHLDDPALVFTQAYKHLKPGGKLIITTPDGDIASYAASAEHIWLLTHEDIDKLYKDAGFFAPKYPYSQGQYGVLFITAVGTKR
jgi:2-polyprenyl-3-methyl-5-hydroxy-6-metoxy-1,4-benzoquinol methylase